MNKTQKIELVFAILSTLMSICIIFLPSINNNIKGICLGAFSFFLLLNVIRFLILKKEKDYEGLYNVCLFLLMIILTFVMKLKEAKNLSFYLLTFITIASLIKLKKADYYHDRKSNMWKIRIFHLIVFLVSGVIISLNLFHKEEIQIILMGFLFLINSFLELLDPIVINLITKKE